MFNVDYVRKALQRMIDEHGVPNGATSTWLRAVEGCPLSNAQINAVGRRYGTVWLWFEGRKVRADYGGGYWAVRWA